MTVTIEAITESLTLGEGPHWDEETETLYFVDIISGSIHKYKPSTKEYAKAKIGESVSIIIPVQGVKNKFIVTTEYELKVITWDGISDKVQSIEKIGEVEATRENTVHRFNDGKADRFGRLWLGTYGLSSPATSGKWDIVPKQGSFYSFGQGKKFKKHLDGVSISNGLAFNDELNKFYYIDSFEEAVVQFDYDSANELISNKETIFTIKKHDIKGGPDGQTIDADGNLWVAVFGGNRVIKIDPRKPETLLQTVELPVKNATSIAFGGKEFDELYVTTANFGGIDKTANGDDGKVFVVKGLGVKGLPAYKFKI